MKYPSNFMSGFALKSSEATVAAMSKAGQFAEAKKSAASFPSPASRDRARWIIGTEQAKQGELAGARETADEITDKALRAIVYCEVAAGFFKESSHLALQDIHDSIEELRHYRRRMFVEE